MVLKIDHVSYSCAQSDALPDLIKDYKMVFSENGRENLSIKTAFFCATHKYHDIKMYSKDNCIPVEVTKYDYVTDEKNGIDVVDNCINVITKRPYITEKFYELHGFKKIEDRGGGVIMMMRALLDSYDVRISINTSRHTPNPWRLDAAGFGAIGVVVYDLEAERRRFLDGGFRCTPIEGFAINGRQLNICFTQGENGELTELIEVRRGK